MWYKFYEKIKYNDKKRKITLLELERRHIKPVSLMLSKAFKDDLKEVFPDPEERRVKTPYVYELYLLYDYSSIRAFVTSPQLEGLAVWILSDKRKKRPFWRILTSGTIWPAIKIGIKALRKIQAQDQCIERKHKELAPYKHWYLALLAVDPIYQGKGYATKLLSDMLSNIDKEGLPCYLETEGEKNVSMYQHFGFEIIDEFIVLGIQHKLVAMLRKSKSVNNEM